MAAQSQPKSYIIAPGSGFSFRRGNPIALGNIFENPLKLDEYPISFRDAKTLPPKVNPPATEVKREITEYHGSKAGIGAWVDYLSTFGARLGAEQAKKAHVVYNIESLETDTFTGEGMHKYFEKRVNEEERLLKAIRRNPMYMITGIKYSTNLDWEIRLGSTNAIQGNLHGMINEDVQAGIGAMNEDTYMSLHKGKVVQEAIFAYQVHRIAYKGWWKKKTLESKLNRDGVALSHGEDNDEDDEDGDDDGDSEDEIDDIGDISLESELVDNIDDLAVENGMGAWNPDGEYIHAS